MTKLGVILILGLAIASARPNNVKRATDEGDLDTLDGDFSQDLEENLEERDLEDNELDLLQNEDLEEDSDEMGDWGFERRGRRRRICRIENLSWKLYHRYRCHRFREREGYGNERYGVNGGLEERITAFLGRLKRFFNKKSKNKKKTKPTPKKTKPTPKKTKPTPKKTKPTPKKTKPTPKKTKGSKKAQKKVLTTRPPIPTTVPVPPTTLSPSLTIRTEVVPPAKVAVKLIKPKPLKLKGDQQTKELFDLLENYKKERDQENESSEKSKNETDRQQRKNVDAGSDDEIVEGDEGDLDNERMDLMKQLLDSIDIDF